jgi:CNT family concentrative nucleoside transporter
MGLSGPSALAVAANIFMGMVETPIVIRAYLEKLTRSELFMMMVVGLATVAGSTMVAYAAILGPTLPNAAGHVLVASIISAPAGVLLARIMIPEGKGVALQEADLSGALRYESAMDAVTTGVKSGLEVVFNIAAMLIVFVAFVALGNQILTLVPPVGGEPVTLERILGMVFAPLAWVIGIEWAEAAKAGWLLGVKMFLTEFVAFLELGVVPADELSQRTRMILAYALCGFANVGSVGIMIAGMSVLMPERRGEIIQLSMKSLLPGFLATCMTAGLVAAMPAAIFLS